MYISRPTRCTNSYNESLLIINHCSMTHVKLSTASLNLTLFLSVSLPIGLINAVVRLLKMQDKSGNTQSAATHIQHNQPYVCQITHSSRLNVRYVISFLNVLSIKLLEIRVSDRAVAVSSRPFKVRIPSSMPVSDHLELVTHEVLTGQVSLPLFRILPISERPSTPPYPST